MKIKEVQKKHEFENILPMVNVVFLLLIFFMVAGTYSSPELFEVTSPNSTSTANANVTTITVVVDQSGRMAIGEIELSHDTLLPFINQHLSTDPSSVIQLKADAEVDALEVVKVIELLSLTKLGAVHILTTTSS